MFCGSCGSTIADNAAYCSACGHPTPLRTAQPALMNAQCNSAGAQWETMEIECLGSDKVNHLGIWLMSNIVYKYAFVARVVTPIDSYIFAAIEFPKPGYDPIEMIGAERSLVQPALDRLLQEIYGDGWQPVHPGQWWYSHRFRRPFDPREAELRALRQRSEERMAPVLAEQNVHRGRRMVAGLALAIGIGIEIVALTMFSAPDNTTAIQFGAVMIAGAVLIVIVDLFSSRSKRPA